MDRTEPERIERIKPIGEFGPFMLIRKLGSGGMGTVYIVRTPWPERPVAALKRGLFGEDSVLEQRFRHEMELAVRLEHPNLITAFDVGSIDGEPYVCSELILGRDLGAIFRALDKKRAVAPLSIAVSVLADTLSALHYVHNAHEADARPLKLVHRDVKPGNIIVGYDGVARLADFGAATSAITLGMQLTKPGEVVGTPSTMAPEVLRYEPPAPPIDVYALGTVIYRFVAGIHPHEAPSTRDVLRNVLHGDPRPLSKYRPDLPDWFVDVVHRMLANDPRSRPTDADLLRILNGRHLRGEIPQPGPEPVRRWLQALFPEEHLSEVRELEAIQQLTLEEGSSSTNTQMFARRGKDSKIESPPVEQTEPTDINTPIDVIAEPELPLVQVSQAFGHETGDLTVRRLEDTVTPESDATSPGVVIEEDGEETSPHIRADLLANGVTSHVGQPIDFGTEETVPESARMPMPAAAPMVQEEVRASVDPASTQPGKLEMIELKRPPPPPPPISVVEAPLQQKDPYTLKPRPVRADWGIWTTVLLVVAGVAIGLGAFAFFAHFAAAPATNVILADRPAAAMQEIKEELSRRRVQMRAMVQDGERLPQEAWLALDRASASLEAGDPVGARQALLELGALLERAR